MNALQYSQRGMALVVTLVLLLVITILGVSSMETTTMQERIAGNTRDSIVAFQAAEAAIRDAEDLIQGAALGAFNGSNGRYEICNASDTRTACKPPAWKDRASSGWKAIGDNLSYVKKQPEYIIEKYTAVENPMASLDADKPLDTYEFYRVTARGYGTSTNSMAVLQTNYRRN